VEEVVPVDVAVEEDVVVEEVTDIVVNTGTTGVRAEAVVEEEVDDEEDCCCALEDLILLLFAAIPPPTPPPIAAPRTKINIAKLIQNIRIGSPHIRGGRDGSDFKSSMYRASARDLGSKRLLESTSSP
jgi:hypothetical protein